MFRRNRNLHELVSGTQETLDLARRLWPEEADAFGEIGIGEACAWLNAKTGLSVPGDAAAHFGHWLPRLREMAA